MKHANVSFFVPHLGCRHQCSFCDQRAITGTAQLPTPAGIRETLESSRASLERFEESEIAFFGGSFTAIDQSTMLSLLSAARPFVEDGTVRGIRISTRPDAVDPSVLSLIRSYGVTAVELGAQSMCDAVLSKNGRGHTSEDTRRASRWIQEAGLELGLQMMMGLPGDTAENVRMTARELAHLNPDTMRIYPVLVLRGTPLAAWAQSGEYRPLSLDETVSLGSELLLYFDRKNIPVIRFGLHDVNKENLIAGPWHPALRELCEARIYRNEAQIAFENALPGEYELFVRPSEMSKMIGQHRENVKYLEARGYRCRVRGRDGLKRYEIAVQPVNPVS